jgi:hypothetical protein
MKSRFILAPLLVTVAIAGCGGGGSTGFNSNFEVQLSSSNIADLKLFISRSGTTISADSCSEGQQSFCSSLEVNGNDVFIRFRSNSDFSNQPVYVWVRNESGTAKNFRVRVRKDDVSKPAYDSNNTTLGGNSRGRFAEIRRNSVSPA